MLPWATMLHTAIDVLGGIVGLLSLVALWLDPREQTVKRKFLIVSLVVIVLFEAGVLLFDRYQEKQKELEDTRILENKEKQLISSLCLRDMNYEEIYTSGNLGWSDETLNAAIDDLMQTKLMIDVDMKYLKLPTPDARPVQVRFYHLKDRSICSSTAIQ